MRLLHLRNRFNPIIKQITVMEITLENSVNGN